MKKTMKDAAMIFWNRRRFFVLGALALALLDVLPARADETPPAVINSFLYGSGIHLGYNGNQAYISPPAVHSRLYSMSITSTRDDVMWGVEQATSPTTLPAYMSHLSYELTNFRARPVMLLVWDATQYPNGQPTDPAGRQKFAAYAASTAAAFKSRNPILEMWNEWNLGPWQTNPNDPSSPANYVELAKVTYPAIKQQMPNGIVLAGAVGDDPGWKWSVQAVKDGVMNYADGFSVHTYNHCQPVANRTGNEIITRVQDLHNQLQPIVPDVPIYITEFGWPTKDSACGGVSEQTQANNIAQVLLWGPAFPWLKGVWVYELSDEGVDPNNREMNFGQFRFDGSAKPAVCAAGTAWQFIQTYSFSSDTQPIEGVEKVSYANGATRHIAMWLTDPAAPARWVQLPTGASGVTLCGTTNVAPGQWVQITQQPLLIKATSANESLIAVR